MIDSAANARSHRKLCVGMTKTWSPAHMTKIGHMWLVEKLLWVGSYVLSCGWCALTAAQNKVEKKNTSVIQSSSTSVKNSNTVLSCFQMQLKEEKVNMDGSWRCHWKTPFSVSVLDLVWSKQTDQFLQQLRMYVIKLYRKECEWIAILMLTPQT